MKEVEYVLNIFALDLSYISFPVRHIEIPWTELNNNTQMYVVGTKVNYIDINILKIYKISTLLHCLGRPIGFFCRLE